MGGEQIVIWVTRDGAPVLLRVDVEHEVEVEVEAQEEAPPSFPHISISGHNTFIADITEENVNAWIGYSASLKFRGPRTNRRRELLGGPSPRARFREMRENGDADQVYTLWRRLYNELSDAAITEQFKIPYAFAFDMSTEEHDLLVARPDEILNIIQGKKRVLTWITPEIQWGDRLRIRFLRDYIKLLRENGFVDWADTVESLEGKNYIYGDYGDLDSLE